MNHEPNRPKKWLNKFHDKKIHQYNTINVNK